MRHVACKNRDKCFFSGCVIHSPKPEHDVKEVVTACARAELKDVNFGGIIEVKTGKPNEETTNSKVNMEVAEIVARCEAAKQNNLLQRLPNYSYELPTVPREEDIPQHEPGAKLDKGKPDVGLVFASFPDAICLVAEVSSFGEKKYSLFGWESVPDALRRYWSALGRHLLKCSKGVFMKQFVRDPESGINELASVAWNALAVLQKAIEYEREHKHE